MSNIQFSESGKMLGKINVVQGSFKGREFSRYINPKGLKNQKNEVVVRGYIKADDHESKAVLREMIKHAHKEAIRKGFELGIKEPTFANPTNVIAGENKEDAIVEVLIHNQVQSIIEELEVTDSAGNSIKGSNLIFYSGTELTVLVEMFVYDEDRMGNAKCGFKLTPKIIRVDKGECGKLKQTDSSKLKGMMGKSSGTFTSSDPNIIDMNDNKSLNEMYENARF